jgi:RNA polymerase sigma-70 factor (ECF subfamily)
VQKCTGFFVTSSSVSASLRVRKEVNALEDNAIIELYFARDPMALLETQEKYGPYCKSISMGILQSPEDAQECVNDTLLRAWDSIPPTRPKVFSAFLGRITRNLSLQRWRNLHAQKRGGGETAIALEELGECVSGGSDPAKSVEEHLDKEALRVVSAMPKWKPGKQRGKPVRCRFSVPVRFVLQQ